MIERHVSRPDWSFESAATWGCVVALLLSLLLGCEGSPGGLREAHETAADAVTRQNAEAAMAEAAERGERPRVLSALDSIQRRLDAQLERLGFVADAFALCSDPAYGCVLGVERFYFEGAMPACQCRRINVGVRRLPRR